MEPARRGLMLVLSSPSGAGKTTLARRLLDNEPGVAMSVSYTTRKRREGESDGKDYHFVDHDTFTKMRDQGEFLEWAVVFDNYYGTPMKHVRENLRRGKHVLLCIDVKGAMLVKKKVPDALMIFVKTPTLDELRRRLEGRGTDSEESVALRLKTASAELLQESRYDHVIVNADLPQAFKDLTSVLGKALR